MQVIQEQASLAAWRSALPAGTPVAFVPTMGALHEGHLALMKKARALADAHEPRGVVAISIFVNPTQFGPNEDLDTYPRTLSQDIKLAQSVGVDLVFAPQSPQELYPHGKKTVVSVSELDSYLCGKSRPGHFDGVCTVVLKLWQNFLPRWAVFGQKDFQQLAILRQMHRDLFLQGEIVAHPIVRQSDGLALSSRNLKLCPASRKQALEIVASLKLVESRFKQGITDAAPLMQGVAEHMAHGEVEYCVLVDATTLEAVNEVRRPTLVAIAARYGGVRLIDNCVLDPAQTA